MGTTAEKLTYLNETKTQLKDMLNLGGASLTTEPFRQYVDTLKNRYLYFINNGTQEVWDNWEKVVGEGTTITLNNTEEAPMTIDLKGNTSQETTTGKNKASNVFSDYSGLTGYKVYPIQLEQGQQYTLSANLIGTKKTSYYNYGIVKDGNTFQDFVSPFFCVDYTTGEARTGTFTIDSTYTNPKLVCYTQTEAIFDELFANYQIQFEKSSSATSYEPYTNGASPNPDYPQDIHVVSGDNSIVVCGKNLFHFESQRNTGWYSDVPNMIKEIGAYTLSINDTSLSGVWAVWFADNNGDRIGNFIKPSSSVSTPSTFNVTQEQANAPYIRILPNASGLHDIQNYKIQIEKGSTATTYEPYTGASYPISLGVENLLQNNATNQTISGVSFTKNSDGTITANGTATAQILYVINSSVSMTGNYVLSGSPTTSQDSTYFLQLYGTGGANDYGNGVSISNFNGVIRIVVRNGAVLNNVIFKPQIEKGTKKSSYTPYGTTPIELCKIGTYQDRFIRNSGKNLFDNSKAQIGKAWNNASNTARAIVLTKVKPNTTYYLSYLNKSAVDDIYWFDRENENDSTYITGNTQITQPLSITTKPNCNYLGIQFNKTSITQADIEKVGVMLNEGTTALPYEPYGTGWYLKKEIGKVVLDGSENWSNFTALSGGTISQVRLTNTNSGTREGLSDRFKVEANYNATEHIVFGSDNTTLYIHIANSRLTTLDIAGFKTWLSNNNTTLYYVLNTPTYLEITDSTLLSQLETVKRSYEGQTNISQTNDDLPFIINATALKEME